MLFCLCPSLAPKNISEIIVPYEQSRTLKTSGRGLLQKPRVRTKCGEVEISVLWSNHLEQSPWRYERGLYSTYVYILTENSSLCICQRYLLCLSDFALLINYVCLQHFKWPIDKFTLPKNYYNFSLFLFFSFFFFLMTKQIQWLSFPHCIKR